MLSEPLGNTDARTEVRRRLAWGWLEWSTHAKERMTERGMDLPDVRNVLRGGVVDGCDVEDGTWRYRVVTPAMTVVVSFVEEDGLVIVTMWRNR